MAYYDYNNNTSNNNTAAHATPQQHQRVIESAPFNYQFELIDKTISNLSIVNNNFYYNNNLSNNNLNKKVLANPKLNNNDLMKFKMLNNLPLKFDPFDYNNNGNNSNHPSNFNNNIPNNPAAPGLLNNEYNISNPSIGSNMNSPMFAADLSKINSINSLNLSGPLSNSISSVNSAPANTQPQNPEPHPASGNSNNKNDISKFWGRNLSSSLNNNITNSTSVWG